MPQTLQASADDRLVGISRLVSGLRTEWQRVSLADGTATSISVHVEIPLRRRIASQCSRA